MALPPIATSANLLLHVLQAHLQVMLWKATDQQAPPDQSSDITHFGWITQNDILIPAVAPTPPEQGTRQAMQFRSIQLSQKARTMHFILQLLWWRRLL